MDGHKRMATFFCPRCFHKIAESTTVCPYCHALIAEYLHSTPYTDRLIHALQHTESEARMAAVIGLGRLAHEPAVAPLLALLRDWPNDVVQGAEAIDALTRIGSSPALDGLKLITQTHPSAVIRHLAARKLG